MGGGPIGGQNGVGGSNGVNFRNGLVGKASSEQQWCSDLDADSAPSPFSCSSPSPLPLPPRWWMQQDKRGMGGRAAALPWTSVPSTSLSTAAGMPPPP
jgi:hypothetical protein